MAKTAATTYADWLRERMRERGLSNIGLARLLNPDDVETARRSVRRYLNGTVPIARTRRVVADALGTGDDLGPDDSEEDRELMSTLMARIEELHQIVAEVATRETSRV